MTGQQLPLNLPFRTSMGRGDFFVAPPNAKAVAQIDAWQAWPNRKLLLFGPQGAGKTHLAHVWAEQSGAELVPSADLSTADAPSTAQAPALVIEDIEKAAGKPEAEQALFHLHNLMQAQPGWLLFTSRLPPRNIRFSLPDLASRIQGTAAVALESPDDMLLSAMLVKLFSDRQMAVAPAVIAYLVARMERSSAAAVRLVALLDQRALAEGRNITTRLAAEVLASTATPPD